MDRAISSQDVFLEKDMQNDYFLNRALSFLHIAEEIKVVIIM